MKPRERKALSAKRNPSLSPIRDEDWNFESCPIAQRPFCRRYEYSRESVEVKKEIAARRETGRWNNGNSPEDWRYYETRAKLTFYQNLPEFPETAWLQIPNRKRTQLCEELRLLEGPLIEVSPERIFPQEPDDPFPVFPSDVGIFEVHRVSVLEIDLTAAKDSIIEAFTRWLATVHRETEIIKEKRGGVTEADLLKILGAYRLVKHFDGDWQKAADWSQARIASGKPLYEAQPEWIKAKKRAESFLSKGTLPTPTARLLSRLDLQSLSRGERASVKVYIMTDVDRAKATRLNKISAGEALTEIRSLASLAHKSPL